MSTGWDLAERCSSRQNPRMWRFLDRDRQGACAAPLLVQVHMVLNTAFHQDMAGRRLVPDLNVGHHVAVCFQCRAAMRIDSASRRIAASPELIYGAFAKAEAMEKWLPPSNMLGEMTHFDFRSGGSYRMRLTFRDAEDGAGKTSQNSDEVEVRLTHLEEGRRIEQEVTFESDDPAFAGVMRMVWTFRPDSMGTIVTVHAENVPRGIRAEDHEVGMKSSLENLAAFVESQAK